MTATAAEIIAVPPDVAEMRLSSLTRSGTEICCPGRLSACGRAPARHSSDRHPVTI